MACNMSGDNKAYVREFNVYAFPFSVQTAAAPIKVAGQRVIEATCVTCFGVVQTEEINDGNSNLCA